MSVTQADIITESVDSNCANIDIRVPADLVYLQGHFPGEPVLPGVVQLHWAIELAAERFGLQPNFKAIEGLKFHRVIPPETTLQLAIEYDPSAGKLRFAYTAGEDTFSQGRVLFE